MSTDSFLRLSQISGNIPRFFNSLHPKSNFLAFVVATFFRQFYHSSGTACLALALIGCGSEEESAADSQVKRAARVEVVEVSKLALVASRTWQGTLEPLRVYEIMAPANGRVSAFRLDVGAEVASGDVVAEMRFPDADARRGELAQRVDQLETEKQRLQRLAESHAASDAEVAAAQIDLLQAKAELRGIEALLAEGMIRAPAAGWVLETAVVAGSSIIEGAVLARLADASSMGVRIQVPNTEIYYFQNTSNLTATTAAGDSHPITKIIRHGAATPNTTAAELWLDVQSRESIGAITVKYESSRDAITIPWSSIANDDERSWVGLLDDKNRIERRSIALGETSGTKAEVLDGLREGDVLLHYQPRSHGEGSQVDPVPHGDKAKSDP